MQFTVHTVCIERHVWFGLHHDHDITGDVRTNRRLFNVWESGSVDTFSANASAVSLHERSIWNCISNTSISLSSWQDAETENRGYAFMFFIIIHYVLLFFLNTFVWDVWWCLWNLGTPLPSVATDKEDEEGGNMTNKSWHNRADERRIGS